MVEVQAFETLSALLTDYDPSQPGCLLLDLHTPGASGHVLYERLRTAECVHPFIVITANATIADAKEAIWRGALDFLEKPIESDMLLARIRASIDEDARLRRERAAFADVAARIDSLTDRQRQVLVLVTAGMLTKQIARELGVSIKTVEAHRSIITKKMDCESVAQLVRVCTLHEVHSDSDRYTRLRGDVNKKPRPIDPSAAPGSNLPLLPP